MGTSLKVSPVSEIPSLLPKNIPAILINRTPNTQIDFDVQLIGYSDVIVFEICRRLGWELPIAPESEINPVLENSSDLNKPEHWHIFSGAQLSGLTSFSNIFDSSFTASRSSSDQEATENDFLISTSMLPDKSNSGLKSTETRASPQKMSTSKAKILKRKATPSLNTLDNYPSAPLLQDESAKGNALGNANKK